MTDLMHVDCEQWRILSEHFPVEMEVIMEMMIESEEELCEEVKSH